MKWILSFKKNTRLSRAGRMRENMKVKEKAKMSIFFFYGQTNFFKVGSVGKMVSPFGNSAPQAVMYRVGPIKTLNRTR